MARSTDVDKVLLDHIFFVDYRKNRDHKMNLPHFHDGYEIHFTLNDDTHYFVDGKKYIGDKGSVAIFNSQEIHRVVVQENILYERFFILFKPHFLDIFTTEYPNVFRFFAEKSENVIHLTAPDQATLTRLMGELIFIQYDNTDNFNELKLKIKLMEIVLFVNELFTKGDSFKLSLAYNKFEEMKQIMKYIKINYSEEISLDALSEKFFISKSTLIRMFKDIVGMTPHEYISYIRIIESKKLLKKGYSIKSVALKVGYGNDSTYIKTFKKIQGVTPKQYILNRGGE